MSRPRPPIQNVTRFIPITFSGTNFNIEDSWEGVLHCLTGGTITAIDSTGVECPFTMLPGERVVVKPASFKLGATGTYQYHIG